jgi:hypothetical protein
MTFSGKFKESHEHFNPAFAAVPQPEFQRLSPEYKISHFKVSFTYAGVI